MRNQIGLSFPFFVTVGNDHEFYVTRRLGADSISNAFEAYRTHQGFLDKFPVIVKAYLNGVDPHLQDIDQISPDQVIVSKDLKNNLIVYGKIKPLVDSNIEESTDQDILPPQMVSLDHGDSFIRNSNYDDNYYPNFFHFDNFRKYSNGETFEYSSNHPGNDLLYFKNSEKNDKTPSQSKFDEFKPHFNSIIHFGNSGKVVNSHAKNTFEKTDMNFRTQLMAMLYNGQYDTFQNLITKYTSLPMKIRQKYNLVNVNASPENILIDQDGELYLDDYKGSVPFSPNSEKSKTQALADDEIVNNWKSYFLELLDRDRAQRGRISP